MEEIPHNIIKHSSGDTEEILLKALNEKYGERFAKYRDDYHANIKFSGDDRFMQSAYPLSVLLELINRCNLDCIMCDQGFRNDIDKVTMSDEILTKLFKDFKKNKLPALMLSLSEPLLYKNIGTSNIPSFEHKTAIPSINLYEAEVTTIEFLVIVPSPEI